MRLPSTMLEDFVQESKLPWISFNPEAGRLEIVIDNYLASNYRSCAAHFEILGIEGWRRKGVSGAPERNWLLDFGTLFHKMMEEYYQAYKSPEFSLEKFAIERALFHWRDMNMDIHLSNKECQELGGYPGFAGMLLQYALQFKAENESLNIIAKEVSFGKKKEVPLYVWGTESSENAVPYCPADIFLSGRMDIIADDGTFISPMDHKTMGSFRRDPIGRFSVDEGPVGYIYALNKLLPSIVPEELRLKRSCNRIIMNLISKQIPKEGSRFQRHMIWKSSQALEAYRIRMIGTCNNLLNDLELHVRGLSMPRDTSKCNNWYFRDCPYLDVHRQQDKAGELATLQNGYVKLPVWDTEAISPLFTEPGE